MKNLLFKFPTGNTKQRPSLSTDFTEMQQALLALTLRIQKIRYFVKYCEFNFEDSMQV